MTNSLAVYLNSISHSTGAEKEQEPLEVADPDAAAVQLMQLEPLEDPGPNDGESCPEGTG